MMLLGCRKSECSSYELNPLSTLGPQPAPQTAGPGFGHILMTRETEPTAVETVPEGKYVYCIIETAEPRSFGPMGIGGRGDDVHTIRHKGLAAVVSNTPLVVYDPTRENVFAHEQVNETVMREFTVLPMAFGALFARKRTSSS